jgi:hypothetical protein
VRCAELSEKTMTIDRRTLFAAGLGAAVVGGSLSRAAFAQQSAMAPVGPDSHPYPIGHRAEPFHRDEIVHAASDFFGVASQTIAGVIERAFKDNGEPTGYVAGEEASGAVGVGLRYGKGLLYMKHRPTTRVYWQGPSIGFDLGGNASRVFTLCYDLQRPEQIFGRFPGVDGSIYFVAGFGVNYQRSNTITLAPIRSGVGARAGANVGYLAYSRKQHILPF